jgi:hypothetical protein
MENAMKRSTRLIALAGGLAALNVAPNAAGSCGSAFCAINTNWDTHGAWAQPGLRLDIRYERVEQNQPLAGSNKVAVGAIAQDHDEVRTSNRNWLATLDYTFNADWGASVALPMVKRDHLHLENDFAAGTRTPESWNFNKLGDARVMARYRIATVESGEHSLGTLGLNFGLKLPTGRTDVRNEDGERAERTLQPGTGTTDALVGAYYAQLLPLQDLSWFTQAQLQLPLNQREGYQPGRRISLDAGLRYDLSDRLGLMLQLNALFRGRDSGANAERDNSGGRSWFLSPGMSYSVTKDVHIYGFVQVPIYQYVNGVQLGTRPAAVLGLSAKF